MKTEWNYSDLAKSYVSRPEYSCEALNSLFLKILKKAENNTPFVCDVGAGVAHLTIPMLERNFEVYAVEPNDEMRKIGYERTKHFKNVKWSEGVGEQTGMQSNFFDFVTFGSSFNVTNRPLALKESHRILKKNGWFVCMWNHRNLEQPLQRDVESIIKKNILNYNYGSRREDQSEIISASKLFKEVNYLDGDIVHTIDKKVWFDAWKSHATLERQAGDNFLKILNQIEDYLNVLKEQYISVEYKTKIWFSQKNN